MLLDIQKNPHELFSFVKSISVFNFAQLQFSCILTDVWHFRSVNAECKQTGIFLCLSIILKQASLTQPFSLLLALWLWKETNVSHKVVSTWQFKSRKLNEKMKDSRERKKNEEGDEIFIYVRVFHRARTIVCQLTTHISGKTPLLH